MLQDRPPRSRWPRAQRFSLSTLGVDVESAYRETIIASRTNEGRASFDAARASWASENRLQPDDGLYLAEVRAGALNLQQIAAALDVCGKTRGDTLKAVERLVDAGYLTTVS